MLVFANHLGLKVESLPPFQFWHFCGFGNLVSNQYTYSFHAMPNLDDILAANRQWVAKTRQATDMRVLEEKANSHSSRGFRKRLAAMSQVGPALIPVLKKVSTSKAMHRRPFPVPSLTYQITTNAI